MAKGFTRKEKKLSPGQAIELAKREVKNLWIGSTPLLTAAKTKKGVTIYPIDEAFAKPKAWALFFIDITLYTGDLIRDYIRTWHFRFSSFDIGFIIFIRTPYSFIEEAKVPAEILVEQKKLKYLYVLDKNDLYAEGFGVDSWPRFLLISGSEFFCNLEGEKLVNEGEEMIHKFLRQEDPGLPLSMSYVTQKIYPSDLKSLEFGKGRGTQFERLPENEENFTPEENTLYFKGAWNQDKECIQSSEGGASICFLLQGTSLMLIAGGKTNTKDPARLNIEVNDRPIFQEYMENGIEQGEQGETLIRIGENKSYPLLKNLKDKASKIKFTIPTGRKMTLTLYGVRFGDILNSEKQAQDSV